MRLKQNNIPSQTRKTNTKTKSNTNTKTKSNMNKKTNRKTKKGGAKLGQGSFGCVIQPPIPCHENSPYNTNKYVSKLIPMYTEYARRDVAEEINIAKIINKFDKHSKYFIVPKDWCNIEPKKIDRGRNNITIKSKTHKQHKQVDDSRTCNIDPTVDIVNLIVPFGGLDLKDILSNRKYKPYREIMKNHFGSIIRNILIGLKLLHKNGVVHLDIKLENFIVNVENNSAYVKYIDMGLGEYVKGRENDNLTLRDLEFHVGTPSYIAPEMYVIYKFAKMHKHMVDTNYLFKTKFQENFIAGILQNLKKHKYSAEEVYKNSYRMNRQVLDFPNVKTDAVSRLTGNLDIIQHADIENLYVQIANMIHKDTIISDFYKPSTGIMYKYDIYSLGISFFLMMKYLDIQSPKMKELIRHMIDLNPVRRFSASECLDFVERYFR